MKRPFSAAATAPDSSTVVTKAAVRAATLLHFSQKQLGEVLGMSPSSVSRMYKGDFKIPEKSGKSLELALMLVRVFRSLDAMVGGDAEKSRAWLAAGNRHLGGIPMTLIGTVEGLGRVGQYLDAMRGEL